MAYMPEDMNLGLLVHEKYALVMDGFYFCESNVSGGDGKRWLVGDDAPRNVLLCQRPSIFSADLFFQRKTRRCHILLSTE